MIVYKVVRRTENGLYSLQNRDLDRVGLTVEYKVGEVTLPKLGLLFAFRQDPREYSGGNVFPVFEAEAEIGRKSTLDHACITWDSSLVMFQNLWAEKPIDPYFHQHVPYGTILCESIKLTRLLR